MPSFFGLKRLSASDIFFRRKKEQQPSSEQTKQKRSLSVSDGPHHRPSIDYHSPVYDHELATKFGDNVMVNDLELLLSMETQARMEAIEARERRSRRLRFSLPPPPIRPDNIAANSARPSSSSHLQRDQQQQQQTSSGRWRHRWKRHSSNGSSMIQRRSSDASVGNDSQMSLSTQERLHRHTQEVGLSSRVQLIRRPLPTYGTVRFIGSVDFAPGAEWIGVELDSRVGKNDGSVKGTRYFDTDRDRGIFILREDLALILDHDSSSDSDN